MNAVYPIVLSIYLYGNAMNCPRIIYSKMAPWEAFTLNKISVCRINNSHLVN